MYETSNSGLSWVKIADAHGPINQLLLTPENNVFGADACGLIQYETTAETTPYGWYNNWQAPSYAQILVILLTALTASLILFGRIGWLEKLQASA